MFASRMSGLPANLVSRNKMVDSTGRWNSQETRPSAYMFFARDASLRDRPNSLTDSTVIPVRFSGTTWYASSSPVSSGFSSYPIRFRFRAVKSAVSMIRVAPRGTSVRFALSAAGFIAISTSGASPGVRMSWSAKCNWNDETPGKVPAGARISAGKLGNVDRSLPNDAVSAVNRSPVSCIPSPESPAKRITTRSSCLTSMVTFLFISKSALGSAVLS